MYFSDSFVFNSSNSFAVRFNSVAFKDTLASIGFKAFIAFKAFKLYSSNDLDNIFSR